MLEWLLLALGVAGNSFASSYATSGGYARARRALKHGYRVHKDMDEWAVRPFFAGKEIDILDRSWYAIESYDSLGYPLQHLDAELDKVIRHPERYGYQGKALDMDEWGFALFGKPYRGIRPYKLELKRVLEKVGYTMSGPPEYYKYPSNYDEVMTCVYKYYGWYHMLLDDKLSDIGGDYYVQYNDSFRNELEMKVSEYWAHWEVSLDPVEIDGVKYFRNRHNAPLEGSEYHNVPMPDGQYQYAIDLIRKYLTENYGDEKNWPISMGYRWDEYPKQWFEENF